MQQLQQIQNDPIINLPSLYKYGMTLINDPSSPGFLQVSSGQCRDSNNIMDIEIGAENLEGSGIITPPVIINTAVNGINGLDEGSLLPLTMYAIYVIADSRYYLPTGAIMTLASNSAPLVPAGYDSMRLIGYWPTALSTPDLESGFYQGISNNMVFWYAGTTRRVLTSGNATVKTNIDLTGYVPPVNNTIITFMTNFVGVAAGDDYFQLFNPTFPTAQYFQYCQVAGISISGQATMISSLIGLAPTIQYFVPSAGDALSLWMNAFEVEV